MARRMVSTAPACIDIHNSRPQVRDDLDVSVQSDRRGSAWFRIHRPSSAENHRQRFLRVGTAEYALLCHLDGQRTLEQARTSAAIQDPQHALSPEQAEALAVWAHGEGLFCGPHARSEQAQRNHGRPRQSLTWIRIPLFRGGPWLQPWVKACGWVFSVPAAIAALVLWMLALGVVLSDPARFVDDLRAIFTPAGWLRLAMIWAMLKVLHEAAHAISCHKFGGRVGEVGIAWMIVAPVAYVDLTDAYRIASRGARMVTSLAGVYVELTVAAVALLGWSQTDSVALSYILSTIAVTAGIGAAAFNLNPLMRLDGYFALTDWLDHPNLASDAQATLRGTAAWLCLGHRPGKTRFGGSPLLLFLYGLAALAYRISIIAGLLLAGVEFYGRPGLLIAAVVLVGWIARPAISTFNTVAASIRRRPAVLIRLSLVWAVGTAIATAAVQLPRLRDTGFVAVIEFVDDIPVRTQTAGFVVELHVQDGQAVRAGDVLVVLENQELKTQRAAAHAQWQTALANSRHHRQHHDTAAAIAQQQSAQALEQRVAELQSREQHLTIRAPRAGIVIARDIESLVGQWITEGQSLGYVVDPAQMKAIVAISQSQLPQLPALLQRPLSVVVAGERIPVTLMTIAKQSSSTAPHASLPATAGGSLATRPTTETPAGELIEPHLKLEVRLARRPQNARAGQPARLKVGHASSLSGLLH